MNMLKYINVTISALMLMIIAGCSDIKDFEKRLESVESRLTALETQVQRLLDNVATLKELKEFHTVNSVVKGDDDTYTITFTNGQTATLYQGSLGFYSPRMTIDEEGFWKMTLTDFIAAKKSVADTGLKGMNIRIIGR